MNRSELKGALVGAGYFAQFQAEAWNRIPGIRIEAVVDQDPDRAREFSERYGIPRTYTELEAMLREEKPDVVDIVTRPETHRELTEQAASHGAHVICQKPMAPTWDDSVAMVEACERAGVRLLMHENWRWQPWYREMKRVIESGALGEVFHIGCRRRTGDGRGSEPYPVQPYFREMEKFLLYETVVHFLDTFRFLGGEIDHLFCQTDRINPVIRAEDYVLLQLRFRSGAHGLIDNNRISGPVEPTPTMGVVWIEGEKGALRLSEDGRLWITEYGGEERPHPYEWSDRGYRGDSVKAAQAHYAECLLTGRPCETEGRAYLKTIAAVFAGYRSAETGQAISMNGTGDGG
ncbi:MAG: Gfo/Idh/MocA family oxidoreductase [Armatimonadetes bacterium]|nr:Gfo/Idh/MocA family oxidoreductase [Armatimonadota bacterium]